MTLREPCGFEFVKLTAHKLLAKSVLIFYETQKTADIARCRIVVRDFATGSASALNVCHCLPSCFPLLDGVSCLPLSPIVSLLVSLCWRLGRPVNAHFLMRFSHRNSVFLCIFYHVYHGFVWWGGVGWGGMITFMLRVMHNALRC